MKTRLVVAVSAVLICFSAILFILAYSTRDRSICSAINRQNASLVASLQRAQKTLPTLAYYKEHPEELSRQLVEIGRTIQTFQPIPC